jgi:type IV pilus assembly protein PilB
MRRKRLGEVLRERGHISPSDLAKALEEQHGKVIRLGELLLNRAVVRKADLVAALQEVIHVPYVDCQTARIQPAALELIPPAVAKRYCVLPVARERGQLVTVMAEPQNLHVIDELRFTSGMEISPRLGFRSEIMAALEQYFPEEKETAEVLKPEEEKPLQVEEEPSLEMEFVSTSSRQANQEVIQELQAELLHKRTPAVRLVSTVIAAASVNQASDIHIEPQADDMSVRIRVDGVLRDLQRVPRSLQNAVVSRIKILADMDIAERRAPQDGRFVVKMGPRELDLRVSTLPTQYGEKVVMRLLDPHAAMKGFAELGLPPTIEEGLTRVLSQPQGMLLVTGPTGSGKSTTLYAALNLLRKPTVNIVTVEDPVEYVLAGINQVHVNTKEGLTFASCLRSILRQDPNVIMVGEIRDRETAEIAMKSSQTGHLVLSTLHTNDSIAAVTRLVDLQIPGFLIASSVSAILAQRLVRRLCSCNDQIPPTTEFLIRARAAGLFEPISTQRVPVGCPTCDHTGFKGRVGIYELLVFDEAIRAIVRAAGRSDELRTQARIHGLKLMQEDALDKLKQGMTTLDDILRVVPFEPIAVADCRGCGRQLVPAFQFCPYCGRKRDEASPIRRVTISDRVVQGAVEA